MTQYSKNTRIYQFVAGIGIFLLLIAVFFFQRDVSEPTPTPDPVPDVVAEVVPEAVAKLARENRLVIETALKGEKTGDGVMAMERVLEVWDPRGFRADTLTDLLGPPSVREEGALTYRFDSGFGGWDWHFLVGPDDTITDVDRQSME